jgi:hypothetical protein
MSAIIGFENNLILKLNKSEPFNKLTSNIELCY